MDGADFLDLYASDDAVARAKADAMLRRGRGLQGTALVTRTLMGDRDPVGQTLGQMGSRDVERVSGAVESRPAHLLAAENLRARQEERGPEATNLLRSTLRAMAPELGPDLDEAPAGAIRGIAPTVERFAAARLATDRAMSMLGLRTALHGYQQKNDPATGETYFFDPVSGATFRPDGSPRTRPLRSVPGLLGGRSPVGAGAAPIGAPGEAAGSAPAPAAPRAPRRLLGGGRAPSTPPAESGAGPGPAAGTGGAAPFPRLYGKILDKSLKDLGADFDPNKGAGEIQKNQARLNAAIRLRKLLTHDDGTIKEAIPPQFMRETAMAFAQLINSGGQPAQSLIEELTPKTGSSDLAGLLQYVTNNPQDAGQHEFVKLYLESADREAQASREALDRAVSARIGKHQRVVRGNPAEARSVLEPYGWTLDDGGRLRPLEARGAGPAPKSAPRPRRTVGNETREWDGKSWVPVAPEGA